MIPKSSSPKGIKENSEIFDFELTDEDMERIRRLVHGKPAVCEANEAVYVKLTLLPAISGYGRVPVVGRCLFRAIWFLIYLERKV